MSMAQDMAERKERPPYVRFERQAVEDPAATKTQGRYVGRDVDFAHITPAYSKDVFITPATEWLEKLRRDVQNERIPREWVEHFEKMYQAWQNGQEMPLNGAPIRGWGVISPAIQETLIRMNIMTVEDLSMVNDEGLKRIGMNGLELKNKAKAWLAQLNDKGPLTIQMASLEGENALLRASVAALEKNVADLKAAFEIKATGSAVPAIAVSQEIAASDVLEPEISHDELVAQYTAKFGKPHHRKGDATMRTELGL